LNADCFVETSYGFAEFFDVFLLHIVLLGLSQCRIICLHNRKEYFIIKMVKFSKVCW
jgi:hypothetical protein